MEATEIIIGKWYRRTHGKGFTDCEMTLELMARIFSDEDIAFNDFSGMPLTEELLLKCGATKSNSVKESLLYSRFRLFWKKSYNYWYVVDSTTNVYMTKIEFLHEWQNFVNIMDGHELQITL